MILLRALVRVVSVLLLVVLALLGLAVAIAAVNPAGVAGSAGLPEFRDTVGGWFDDLEASGPIAVASALTGLATLFLGLLLLVGLLVPRRERLVQLDTSEQGALSARRRPLSQMAVHLAEQARGVTHARTKVRPGRRGGGRLLVRADRPRTAAADPTRDAVVEQLTALTEPFKLKARVHVRQGERGRRVQ